jgi:hypothetical protein
MIDGETKNGVEAMRIAVASGGSAMARAEAMDPVSTALITKIRNHSPNGMIARAMPRIGAV